MGNDDQSSGGSTTREEVAPGLVMEKELTAEPDGRPLIYYRFHRQHAAETENGNGEPERP
jgi:hypothetical protein